MGADDDDDNDAKTESWMLKRKVDEIKPLTGIYNKTKIAACLLILPKPVC